jgi:hypothetical protein
MQQNTQLCSRPPTPPLQEIRVQGKKIIYQSQKSTLLTH